MFWKIFEWPSSFDPNENLSGSVFVFIMKDRDSAPEQAQDFGRFTHILNPAQNGKFRQEFHVK
jgi:hypothetical protein